jgi:tetratricopeptide (TPR) repeat protein
VLLGLTILPVVALACLNDRDTLAFEKRNVDALARVTQEKDPVKHDKAVEEIILRAIGGRFDRFPARYYQMRIDRLEAQPKLSAREYDDLAVAYDRLAKVDRAIKVLQTSRSARTTTDDQYRYHANYGTFLVHRWILNGHLAKDVGTLDQSIAEIQSALKINPASHFGREKVQLKLEQFWRESATSRSPKPLDSFFGEYGIDEDAQVGIAGLIMMGLAYELPDAYLALAKSNSLSRVDQSVLYDFAGLRVVDLDPEKIKPIGKFSEIEDDSIYATGNPNANEQYKQLRRDGETVYQKRLAYMNARFDKGQHPDTHADFWKEWEEPPYPVLNVVPDPTYRRTPLGPMSPAVATAMLVGAGLVICVIMALVSWIWGRLRRRA